MSLVRCSAPVSEPREVRQWNPYTINGGTAMAVAGKDFVVVGADTRMSTGYQIMSRTQPKVKQLTKTALIATAGMQADRDAFHTRMAALLVQYEHAHGKTMGVNSISRMVSTQLYYRRFFPYYTFNVVAGIEADGTGAVYGYDAVGSFERVPYGVQGTGSALATSILDNQVEFKTHPSNYKELSLTETLELVKDVFTSIGERDIYTGDFVDLYTITKDGTTHEKFELKLD